MKKKKNQGQLTFPRTNCVDLNVDLFELIRLVIPVYLSIPSNLVLDIQFVLSWYTIMLRKFY